MAAGPAITGFDILDAEPPRFTADGAATVAERHFGIRGSASELASERDQNFLIDAGPGDRSVLKISNPAESADVLDMETGAALHAKRADPELPIALPREVGPAGGPEAHRVRVPGPDGSEHWARLFELMPGEASFDPLGLDHDALWAFGRIVARTGRALRSFFHPAAGRILPWDVQHAARLRPLAEQVESGDRRELLLRTLGRFEERVVPVRPRLRSQVIHGDLSADNTTVDRDRRVAGIIDFGDASHTALVCDISSAWASLVWDRRGDELFTAAAALLDGYQEVTPLEELELSLLGDLFAARAAAAASISAVRVQRNPDNEYLTGFDEHAWPLLELYDELGPDEAARRFGARDLRRRISIDRLLERRADALGSALLAPSYRKPLHLVEGRGVWMSDADGRRYLDAYNNVPVVGHSHPRVVEAVARQSRALNTNMRYLHEAVIELAERLTDSMPAGSKLDTVMMVNSGSEATDLAWRLATAWSGNRGGVVSDFAYHGISAVISDLSPEGWREARPEHVETFLPPTPAEPSGSSLAAAIERLGERDIAPALVMVDGAFTSDGVHPPPPGALEELVRLTRNSGGLYVADEVQAGHGRSGEHLWSFAARGISPDIVTLGKPMGNGYPVAAVITRREIVDRFAEEAEFFSTFGGNPPGAVAALSVLDVIDDEGLIEHAGRIGAELRTSLEGLAASHPAIGPIRGWGLMTGVEIVAPSDPDRPDPALADRVINEMRDRGVLIGLTGRERNVLKIRPPLVVTSEQIGILIDALDRTFAATVPGP